ncbi:unnamed protein product [Didymodactylos carnosus]|uniref:Uncharacterized protein n=1 Tax=Didymodactylos carnosus TaxID=1234261 RepID=A0A815ABZ0_9BILA|nr:unnamed protein product [Didymodactylos carnosus]CAF1255415.1 unnamed protein product [Didymodactylos carnosus]CAF3609059.1 unnamed protein product [Didymodactylos carnosus]CAF4027591.1 unnamed protein product [Didymodactylos carnosus]
MSSVTSSSIISRHLLLVDCDGGRGRLFERFTIQDLPKYTDIYLFWNNTDAFVTAELNKLKTITEKIHLCPSHLIDCKNSADGKLIYFLGKLVKDYDRIWIIQGSDRIYEEIEESVNYEYPHEEKIKLIKITVPGSIELGKILMQIRQQSTLNRPRVIPIQNGIEFLNDTKCQACPLCTSKKRQFGLHGLLSHLRDKHKRPFTCRLFLDTSSIQNGDKADSSAVPSTEKTKAASGALICSHTKLQFIFEPSVGQTFTRSPAQQIHGEKIKCPHDDCQHKSKSYGVDGLVTHCKCKHKLDLSFQCGGENTPIMKTKGFKKHLKK